MGLSIFITDRSYQREQEARLQARATSLARAIDLRLWTYTAALETIAQSQSLVEEFELTTVEQEARRVGELFGGWFNVTAGGDVMEFLMSNVSMEGPLPPPEPRSNFPEVVRAEEDSIRLGRSVVSDAFPDRIMGELVVTIASPIVTHITPTPFIYFAVTLHDITGWLTETPLPEEEFAAIADGSRRVIARSRNNEDFLLAVLPDWYIGFSEGRDSGVAIGPSLDGGESRLFAMQRLEVAPRWTLALSSPLPPPFSALYRSAWPALTGLIVLLIGGTIAVLFLGQRLAKAEAMHAVHEISERDRLLAKVRAAEARKGRLMAVLAHDLRTPLVSVLSTLDLFREGMDSSTRDVMLQRVKRDGHGMLQLIDDVMELSRLAAGEARLRPEPFELKALMDRVAALVRPSAQRDGTEVKVEVETGIMPALLGDVMALQRILLNFATNAVKAARGGTVQISANREASGADGHTVIFAVTDNGCGIAAEDIPRLFRDFGMLERDAPTPEGTGLGLAICRRLATAMGGEVGVESTQGKGSRFWLRVTLPEAVDTLPANSNAKNNPVNALAGLKILIADDHETIRKLTVANVEHHGARATEATDGEVAVALAEAEKFDVILMDLRMPRLDGDKAADRIRRGRGPSAQARIIAVTAHQPPEIAMMLSDLAFDACLEKPLNIGKLVAVLQDVAPPVPASVSSEDFDTETLAELSEIDDGALLTRSMKSFSAEIKTSRDQLAALIAEGDTVGAGRLAHRLAGLSDTLGARMLASKFRKVELLTTTRDIAPLHKELEQLESAIIRTQSQIDCLIHNAD